MASMDIVDEETQVINESNFRDGGMYFQALQRVQGDDGVVRHELDYFQFVDCCGIKKTAIISTNGEVKIMLLVWLIEPVQEFLTTANFEKEIRNDIVTAVGEPKLKKLTMRIDPALKKTKSTDFSHKWKVILPHESENDILTRDASKPIRVRVEYLPRVVAIENVCPCGTHFILNKFRDQVNDLDFVLEDSAYKKSYHFEDDKHAYRLFCYFPSVTKLFITCYDYEMLTDRPFPRALRGTYEENFLHIIDKNMDEIHLIKNNRKTSYLVINWGLYKCYKHLKYINYQACEVPLYQSRKTDERLMMHYDLVQHLKWDPLEEKPLDDMPFQPDLSRAILSVPSSSKKDCIHCTHSYQSLTALEHHIRLNHPSDLMECLICGKLSQSFIISTGQLKRHMDSFHKKENEFKCKKCSRRYKSKKSLTAHKARCRSITDSLNQEDCIETNDGLNNLLLMMRRNAKPKDVLLNA